MHAVLDRRARTARERAFSLAELGDACVRVTTAWFNPRPSVGDGDPYTLLERMPYPGDEDLPFGADFAQPPLDPTGLGGE